MNWLTSLFTRTKTVDNVFDKKDGLLVRAGGWIDGLHYSDQEKAEINQQMVEGAVKFVTDTLPENSTRSQSRRDIANLWIKAELGLILLSAIARPWSPDIAAFYWQMATSELMFWGTISVLTFFFGPYMVGSHLGKLNREKPDR